MKIYTGTGDKGQTSLFSGERVLKDSARVKAYGSVDELNSFIGALVAALPPESYRFKDPLQQIQNELFHVGSWLATMPEAPVASHLKSLRDATVRVETAIDQLQMDLEPLNDFILPGGHPAAAMAHIARSVCRRVERNVVSLTQTLASEDTLPAELQNTLIYLNRLSDYLFVLARTLNKANGVADTVWSK